MVEDFYRYLFEIEMELENYKKEHRKRVYYPNVCNYCFSMNNLKRCSACLKVYYCSKEHQKNDWAFHKPTCAAMNELKTEIPFPEDCDDEKYLVYSEALLEKLMEIRGYHNDDITEYEKQICSILWLCAFCYKKPLRKHVCEKCLVVGYCSEAHKESDLCHRKNCISLRFCRIFDSLNYENSYKFTPITSTYYPIKKKLMYFPTNKFEFGLLMQNQVRDFSVEENIVALNVFLEQFMPAATIIFALESCGMIQKRQLVSKEKNKNKKKHATPEKSKNSKMTIHIIFGDDYELSFQWDSFAKLLIDWIENISSVEVVLTSIKYADIPDNSFESTNQLFKLTVYGENYSEMVFSEAPDILVLFECQRGFYYEKDLSFLRSYFNFENVPFIFASGDNGIVENMCNLVTKLPDVVNMTELLKNDYTDYRIQREWKFELRPYRKNKYFAVYRRS